MEKSRVKAKDGLVPERHCLRAAETFGMLINGIVAAENLEQAVERCGTKQGNKGFAAMQSAIEMASVISQLNVK